MMITKEFHYIYIARLGHEYTPVALKSSNVLAVERRLPRDVLVKPLLTDHLVNRLISYHQVTDLSIAYTINNKT